MDPPSSPDLRARRASRNLDSSSEIRERHRLGLPTRYPLVERCCCVQRMLLESPWAAGDCGWCWRRAVGVTFTRHRFVRLATEGGRTYGKASVHAFHSTPGDAHNHLYELYRAGLELDGRVLAPHDEGYLDGVVGYT